MSDIKYDQYGNAYKWRGDRWQITDKNRGVADEIILGAGEQLTSMGRGLATAFDFLPGMEGVAADARANQASEAEARQFLSDDAPIASNIGRALPFMATAPLGAGGVTARGVAGITGADMLLGASAMGTPGERLENAVLAGAGTLTGFGIGSMATRVARSINSSANEIAEAAMTRTAPARPDSFLPGSVGSGQVGEVVYEAAPGPATFQFLKNAGRQIAGEGIDSPADLNALLKLRENDFMLRPGAASGNVAGKQIFAAAESNPILSDVVQDTIAQPNAQTFNRMIFKAMGDPRQNARVAELTADTVGDFRQQAGALVDNMEKQAGRITANAEIVDQMQSVRDSYKSNFKVLNPDKDPVLGRLDNVIEDVTKGMDAEDLVTLRSDVRELQLKKEGGEARAYQQMVELMDRALEDALTRNGSPDAMLDYRTALARYRLARALDAPGVVGPEGDVRPAALARNLKKTFKAEWGQNDRFGTFGAENMGQAGANFTQLFDVTKALQRFPRVVNDSGTATRLTPAQIADSPVLSGMLAAGRPLLRRMIRSSQLSPEDLRELLQQLPQ